MVIRFNPGLAARAGMPYAFSVNDVNDATHYIQRKMIPIMLHICIRMDLHAANKTPFGSGIPGTTA